MKDIDGMTGKHGYRCYKDLPLIFWDGTMVLYLCMNVPWSREVW